MAIVLGPGSVRVYVRGRRVHHGLTGIVLAGIGAALVFHDRKDFPFPLTDSHTMARR